MAILNSGASWDVSSLQAEAVLGALGGGIGALLTTPTDVVTTRIITQSVEDEPLGFLDMTKKAIPNKPVPTSHTVK